MVPRLLVLVCLLLVPVPARAQTAELSPAARAILAGAREEARRKTRYDISMGYYITRFKDGVDMKRAVFPGGDVDPAIGVCTDLVVRALRRAGYDLQALVNRDRREHPRARYVGRKPNANIDQRRVPNLLLYLRRHGKRLTTKTTPETYDQWLGGDIVFWNLDGRGRIDHVGIVSDKRGTGRRPFVIHAYPSPGFTAELDVLESWPVVGHYRFPKSGKVRGR